MKRPKVRSAAAHYRGSPGPDGQARIKWVRGRDSYRVPGGVAEGMEFSTAAAVRASFRRGDKVSVPV